MAELSVVVVIASLVAGVFVGTGLSRTAVDVADGLTWLSDDPTGEVIEVNPATGRPEVRIPVGAPGDDLAVAQYDGRLFVTNHTTGELYSFDLASILVSGQRRVSAGGATDTLEHDGQVFLVDSDTSTVAAIDPVTTDAIGAMWVADDGLADAAIDQSGTIWAIDQEGLVSALRWSPADLLFVVDDTREVEHSGPGSIVVGHEQGATVFGPDEGIVVQVGTGDDVVAEVPGLSGPLSAPSSSPAALVPVAAPDTGTVVLVDQAAEDEQVIEVDVATIGCRAPGRPEVFMSVVYVPCPGDGKVVRLDDDGERAGPDIETPEGRDPEVVVDDDHLIINVPGSSEGIMVDDEGDVSSIVRYDEELSPTPLVEPDDPVVEPDPTVVEDVIDDDRPPTGQLEPDGEDGSEGGNGGGDNGGGENDGNGNGPDDDPSDQPTDPTDDPTDEVTDPSTPTTPPTPDEPLAAPTGVTAVGVAANQVQVSWEHPGGATAFVVSTDSGADLTTVGGDNRQAVVTVTPGVSNRFVVTARDDPESAASAPSGPITTSGRPGQPANVSATGSFSGAGPRTYTVDVSWDPAGDNGAAVSGYDVSVSTPYGSRTASTGASGRSATVTFTCHHGSAPDCSAGSGITATVTATNANGAGSAASVDRAGPTPPEQPLPAGGRQHVANEASDGGGHEGAGNATLTLSPPADWAGFTGTCRYDYSGPDSHSGVIPCAETNLSLNWNSGYRWEPSSGQSSHQVVFTASNGNGTVSSATYSWTTTQPVLCQGCQIP